MLLDGENGAQVVLPSSTRCANGWPHLHTETSFLAAVFICHCSGYTLFSLWWQVLYCCRGNAWTFSEQVIASIIWDSRRGMSDVAFCTAPPIGWPSCQFYLQIAVTCDLRFSTGTGTSRLTHPEAQNYLVILLLCTHRLSLFGYHVQCGRYRWSSRNKPPIMWS